MHAQRPAASHAGKVKEKVRIEKNRREGEERAERARQEEKRQAPETMDIDSSAGPNCLLLTARPS